MLFEVCRKNNVGPDEGMMSTTSISCIDFKYLKSQENAGYYFKLNGKKVSIKQIDAWAKEMFEKYRCCSSICAKCSKKCKQPYSSTFLECNKQNYVEDAEVIQIPVSEDCVEISDIEIKKTVDSTPTENKKVSKQVICVDTGKIYKNQSEAAKDLGIDPAQVSDSIKTGRKRSGYLFQRYDPEER